MILLPRAGTELLTNVLGVFCRELSSPGKPWRMRRPDSPSAGTLHPTPHSVPIPCLT